MGQNLHASMEFFRRASHNPESSSSRLLMLHMYVRMQNFIATLRITFCCPFFCMCHYKSIRFDFASLFTYYMVNYNLLIDHITY